jgi:hypothetical protein
MAYRPGMEEDELLTVIVFFVALVIGLVLVAVCILFIMAGAVAADDNFGDNPLSFAPPGLDNQQATRWINCLPWARPYLARLWGIDQQTAEKYGAEYKMPTCGLAAYNPSAPTGWFPNPSGFPAVPGGDRWDRNDKYIEQFTPIPIKYPDYSDYRPNIVKYEAPPQLDSVQTARWAQALPWARWYLAKIWEIPEATAAEYGAR